jgi:uncharacterized membrane protein
MKKLLYLWDELKASFWFIPILMLLAAVASSVMFIHIDNRFDYKPDGFLKFFFSGSVDSARSILSIIAGAMIGVAGTIFSITLVVLTLASSQFGSRLVRNFMYDRLNQVVLGTYVSSFIYCLIILNSIKGTGNITFNPVISVFAALITAIAGIVLLIVFIHHVSVSIQSEKVISDISDSMSRSIEKLFPGDIGEEEDRDHPDIETLRESALSSLEIKCRKGGYLQSVDGEGLLEIAEKNDCIIIIYYRPGDYLVKGMKIGEVLCFKECNEDILIHVNDDFITGKVRTAFQDAEFSIHQMVEVASRALSPGINDPYTAIACIDNLTSVMCYLARASFPSPNRYDKEGRLRLVADNNTFAGMLNASFNSIRQYGEGNPSVMIRLIESFHTIMSFAVRNQYREEIKKHAGMVIRAAERSFRESGDLDDIRKRFELFTEELSP